MLSFKSGGRKDRGRIILDLFKALRIAIQSEIGAQRMYSRLSAETSDPEAKSLFRYLEEYETIHQQLLEAERTILTAANENKEINTPD